MSQDLQASLWMFFGRLHPLVLHLPIGLWFGVVVLEFGGAIFRRKPKTNAALMTEAPPAPPVAPSAITTLAWIAALSGAFAASTGWMLGEEGANSGTNFELHRWFGVSAGTLGLLAALASGFRARRAFRSLLVALLMVLLPAGHLGGGMTHGEDFLTEPFAPKTAPAKPAVAPKPTATPAAANSAASNQAATPTAAQTQAQAQSSTAPTNPISPTATVLVATTPATYAAVQMILKRTCIPCHNPEKHKGDLQLHDRAGIEKGGENGAVLVPGKPDESKLLTNVLLPLEEEGHMPPKGKPQPTADEIATLRAWIAAGAPFAEAAAPAAQSGAAGGSKVSGEPVKSSPVETKLVETTEVKTTEVKGAPVAPAPAEGGGTQPVAPASATAPTPRSELLPGATKPTSATEANGKPAAAKPAETKQDPVKATPTKQETAPATPAERRQADATPAQPVTATATATVTVVAKPAAPATEAPKAPLNRAAIEALRMRQIDVREAPPGGMGLTIDFAAVATTMTEAETKSLLQPLVEHITDLGLARVPVGDELCTLCSRMPSLTRLDLRLTQVTSTGVQSLASLKQLKELILAQTRLDDRAVDAILALPALTKVYVWNSGLPNEAIARLRQKQGLTVDAGDTPPAKALEVEGELKFVNELPLPGQKPASPEVAAALTPVNAVCPVSGKPIDPQFVVVHGQQAVGFCCMNCPKAFWAEPAKYPIKAK